jgi:hypothetical protein
MSPGYQVGTALPVRAAQPPRRRWIWITVALLTALVLVTPVALRLWLKAAHRSESLAVRVYRQPLTQLRIVARGDGVTVVPSRQGDVTVTGTLSWVFARPLVTQAVRGKTLQITGSCPGPNAFEDCQIGLTVHVPAQLAVRLSAGSGSITVRGLTGPLHLAVTSGSIALARDSGPVFANDGSGSVTAAGMTSPVIEAVIGSGYLRLGLATAPRNLNVAIGSGSGSIIVPRGTRVRTDTDGGSGLLRIAPGIADSAAPGTMTLTIGTGLLTVEYSRQPAAAAR